MICQECGQKPAALHFTKIINGEKTEFHICESCAREMGEILPGGANGFSIHNLLSGLLDFSHAAEGPTQAEQQKLRCEHCGLTYAQFSKLGRFGCSECYQQFAERLDPLLKRVHGNTKHIGKVPKRSGGIIKDKRRMEQLRADMAKAIELEEFEEAAALRDQIKELERKVDL